MPYDSDSEDEEQLLSWDAATNREAILFCIDCGPKMHEINPDSVVTDGDDEQKPTSYFHMALKAVVQMQIHKLIESPEEYVGIMLFNSHESDCPLTGKATKKKGPKISNAHPHCYLIQSIDQISVPAISELKLQLDSEDPDYLKENYKPYEPSKADKGYRIFDYLDNARQLLFNSGKGTKRCFWITNDDRPFREADAGEMINRTGQAMRKCKSSNLAFEPFFISSNNKRFDIAAFYADAFAMWDVDGKEGAGEGEEGDELGIPPIWAAETKFADFDTTVAARKRPKRTLFKVPMQLADGIRISVKGYTVTARSKKGLPLKTSSMEVEITSEDEEGEGGEGGSGFKTVNYQLQTKVELKCKDTGLTLAKEETLPAFRLGGDTGARGLVEMDDEELRKIRTMDMDPILKIIGFRNRDLVKFEETVSNAYFIYPYEDDIPGSTRAFSALLQVLLKRNKVGVGILLSRQNTSPYFVAVLPQAEKQKSLTSAKEDEYIPPGMILIPLPYADDIRAMPEGAPAMTANATDDQVEKMRALLVRNAQIFPFNPDLYPNPSLGYHNAVLKALAFGDPLPDTYDDTSCNPDYSRIQKFAKRFQNLNASLDKDPEVEDSLGPLRQIRKAWEGGVLPKYTVDQLKKACETLNVAKTGKKADLIERLESALSKM